MLLFQIYMCISYIEKSTRYVNIIIKQLNFLTKSLLSLAARHFSYDQFEKFVHGRKPSFLLVLQPNKSVGKYMLRKCV